MSTNINETLEAIEKGLEGLLVVDESAQPEAHTFTPEQFIAYVAEQIELAKADENSMARISYIREIVALAKAGGFEDKQTVTVPLYQSGPLSVQGQSAESAVTESSHAAGSNKANEPGECGAFARDVSSPSMPDPKAESSTMPPVSMEPVANPEGYIAKAEKSATETALLEQLSAVLSTEEKVEKKVPGDGWVHDLASPQFLDGKPLVEDELEDFGIVLM